MAPRQDYKYGEFPVFKYAEVASDSCTFVPPERIQFTNRKTDDLFKPKEHDPEPEVIDLDPEPEIIDLDDPGHDGRSSRLVDVACADSDETL
jgi:hypothetical protein